MSSPYREGAPEPEPEPEPGGRAVRMPTTKELSVEARGLLVALTAFLGESERDGTSLRGGARVEVVYRAPGAEYELRVETVSGGCVTGTISLREIKAKRPSLMRCVVSKAGEEGSAG